MTSYFLKWIGDLSWSDVNLRGAVFAFIATLALIIALKILVGFVNRLKNIYKERIEASRPVVQFQRRDPAITSQIQRSVINLLKLLHLLVAIVLIDIYVMLLLSLFPATQEMSDQYFTFIVNPFWNFLKSIAAYIPNAIDILVIVAVTFLGLRILRIFFRTLEFGVIQIPGFYRDWSDPTYKLLRAFVLMFLLVYIFPLLPGSDGNSFKAVSIFVGALLSLGSTGAMKNAIAGVVLAYSRAFQVGDWVRIGHSTGEVMRKALLETRLRTNDNELVTIPNRKVMNENVVNFTPFAKQGQLGLTTALTISYDVDWRKVTELLLKAADATPKLSSDPAPVVLQTGLDDYYVSYKLRVFTKGPPPLNKIHTILRQNILDTFNNAGVEIMSPSFQVERNHDQPAMPKSHELSGSYNPIKNNEKSSD